MKGFRWFHRLPSYFVGFSIHQNPYISNLVLSAESEDPCHFLSNICYIIYRIWVPDAQTGCIDSSEWCGARIVAPVWPVEPCFNKRYHVLSWGLAKTRRREIGSLNTNIALKFDRRIGSSAADVPFKISEWSDNFEYKSHGLEILRDLKIRRLIGYWNRARNAWPMPCLQAVQLFHIFRNMFQKHDISSWDIMPESWFGNDLV